MKDDMWNQRRDVSDDWKVPQHLPHCRIRTFRANAQARWRTGVYVSGASVAEIAEFISGSNYFKPVTH